MALIATKSEFAVIFLGRSDGQVACSGAYKSLQNLMFIEQEGMLHAGYVNWVAAIVLGINA